MRLRNVRGSRNTEDRRRSGGAGKAGIGGVGRLEPGDSAEALNAARKIGDDHLQASAGRAPQPHIFAQGTSDQRSRWFATGHKTGARAPCDTFSTNRV